MILLVERVVHLQRLFYRTLDGLTFTFTLHTSRISCLNPYLCCDVILGLRLRTTVSSFMYLISNLPVSKVVTSLGAFPIQASYLLKGMPHTEAVHFCITSLRRMNTLFNISRVIFTTTAFSHYLTMTLQSITSTSITVFFIPWQYWFFLQQRISFRRTTQNSYIEISLETRGKALIKGYVIGSRREQLNLNLKLSSVLNESNQIKSRPDLI